MLHKIVLAGFLLSIVAVATFAQDAPVTQPSPSPKPPVKRRGLDQFGLSNGIRLPAASSSGDSYAAPTTVERVDQNVFDTINQITESASFLDGELARALEEHAEISASSPFGKFFVHRVKGIFVLSETHRLDTLGLGGVKSESNKDLLFRVQDSANDILELVRIDAAGYTESPEGWNGLSEKYIVPLLDTGPNTLRLNKPALLTAMMRRMTSDLAQLKKQLVVKK